MTEYKVGLGCLFSLAAREASKRFVMHWDNANQCWNVFQKVGLFEDFIQSFEKLSDAQDFCDINNGVADALGGE